MDCPSCGKPLEIGKLKFSDKLKWVPNHDQTLLETLLSMDSIVLSDSSILRFQSIQAYGCSNCKMIIIKY